ncbi:MAG: SMC-Scp complex subunit ScpB [Actinomycetota bacterium]
MTGERNGRAEPPSVDNLTEARRAIEAMLLVASDPTPVQLLAQLVELPVDLVQAMCEEVAAGYESEGRGFQLVEIAGGWRYQTHPDTHAYVERFALEGVPNRLSSAALETMAIVAYKQPISRAQIGAIRGVNVDGVLRTLVQRGYVEETGRDDGPGQATLFGTTPFFLEQVGLMSLDDLPPLGDFVPSAQVLEALEHTLRVDGEPEIELETAPETATTDGGTDEATGEDASAPDVVDLRINGHPLNTNGSSNGNGSANGVSNGHGRAATAEEPEPVPAAEHEAGVEPESAPEPEPMAEHGESDSLTGDDRSDPDPNGAPVDQLDPERDGDPGDRGAAVDAAAADQRADDEDLFEVVAPGRNIELATTPPAPVEPDPASMQEPAPVEEASSERQPVDDSEADPGPRSTPDDDTTEANQPALDIEPEPEVVADPEVDETPDPTTTGADGVDDARFPGAGDASPAIADTGTGDHSDAGTGDGVPGPGAGAAGGPIPVDRAGPGGAPALRPPAGPGRVVGGDAPGAGPAGRAGSADGTGPAGSDPMTDRDRTRPEPGDA